MNRRNYLDILTGQIRCKRARSMIEEEFQGHIDEQKLDFMAEGMTEQEAEEAAVREMGDPVDVGVELDRIHRPKMNTRLIALVIVLGNMGLTVQTLVEKAAVMCGAASRMDTGFDTLVPKSALFMLVGIVIMLGICFLDYTLLGKYALWIWGALMAGIAFCKVAGMRVNGGYPRANMFVCLLVPTFGAVLYHFRGKGMPGLYKSILCLWISVFLPLMLVGSSVYVILFWGTAVILVIAAIGKRWFGVKRKQLTAKALGLTAVVPIVVFFLILIGAGMTSYRQERLQQFLEFKPSESYQMIDEALTEAGRVLNGGQENIVVNQNLDLWLSQIRSDYVWLFVSKTMGGWSGIVYILPGFILLGMLFWIVHRQRNQLGYIVGLGCSLMLMGEVMIYWGMNIGYIKDISVYLPFFSYGGINALVTYIYMGLFLSISRNQNIVPSR